MEELQAELSDSEDVRQMSKLVTKVEELIEQVEQLQSQTQEIDKWKDEMCKESENCTLTVVNTPSQCRDSHYFTMQCLANLRGGEGRGGSY